MQIESPQIAGENALVGCTGAVNLHAQGVEDVGEARKYARDGGQIMHRVDDSVGHGKRRGKIAPFGVLNAPVESLDADVIQ